MNDNLNNIFVNGRGVKSCCWCLNLVIIVAFDLNLDTSADHENEESSGEATYLEDNQLEAVVDQVLSYDYNKDGYLSFGEFRDAQVDATHQEEKRAKKCTTCGD